MIHHGVELRANHKSIFHRCHLFEVAFVWELTRKNIHLPLGCLQGEYPLEGAIRSATRVGFVTGSYLPPESERERERERGRERERERGRESQRERDSGGERKI